MQIIPATISEVRLRSANSVRRKTRFWGGKADMAPTWRFSALLFEPHMSTFGVTADIAATTTSFRWLAPVPSAVRASAARREMYRELSLLLLMINSVWLRPIGGYQYSSKLRECQDFVDDLCLPPNRATLGRTLSSRGTQ